MCESFLTVTTNAVPSELANPYMFTCSLYKMSFNGEFGVQAMQFSDWNLLRTSARTQWNLQLSRLSGCQLYKTASLQQVIVLLVGTFITHLLVIQKGKKLLN